MTRTHITVIRREIKSKVGNVEVFAVYSLPVCISPTLEASKSKIAWPMQADCPDCIQTMLRAGIA